MVMQTRIVETLYDGFIVVLYENGQRVAYEGRECCPEGLKKYLEKTEPEKQSCFHYEAVWNDEEV